MKPLLQFADPSVPKTVRAKSRGMPPLHHPPISSRKSWYEAQWEKLEKSLADAAIDLEPGINSADKVLVITTKGDCHSFINALAHIDGATFLHAQLWDHVEANEDFYFSKDEKPLKTLLPVHMYISMADASVVQQLKRLWSAYVEDEDYQFPQNLASLRRVFDLLDDIRYWGVGDRIRHFKEQLSWHFKREYQSLQLFPVEIELWFSENPLLREQREKQLCQLIELSEGVIETRCCIPEIQYHAVKAKITPKDIAKISENAAIKLKYVDFDGVMYLHVVGQAATDRPKGGEFTDQLTSIKNPSSIRYPKRVAMLDGFPLAKHALLEPFLEIEDIHNVQCHYNAVEQFHGTSVASTIIFGDYSNLEDHIGAKIHVIPILQPSGNTNDNSCRKEVVPDRFLPVDIVRKSVDALFSKKENQRIKVINLSIGDDCRLFEREISAWARLLDWLSFKYQILFIVSTGNYTLPIELKHVKPGKFLETPDINVEKEVIGSLFYTRHRRKLMSPSESINSLTVGAINSDNYGDFDTTSKRDLYITADMPSPLNPISLGFRKSVKPELLLPGGRQAYIEGNSETPLSAMIDPDNTLFPPGLRVAVPSPNEGEITRMGYVSGTSYAAGLATHNAAKISVMLDRDFDINEMYYSVLIKALLVHGSEFRHSTLKVMSDTLASQSGYATFTNHQLWGYGSTNTERVRGCEDNQATMLYAGKIEANGMRSFSIPKPASFNVSDHIFEKRLIITLAWLSRTNPSNSNKYRRNRFEIGFSKSAEEAVELGLEKRDFDHNKIGNGTVIHDLYSGSKVAAYLNEDAIELTIRAIDTNDSFEQYQLPYALIVTIDTPGTKMPVYQEVSNALDAIKNAQLESEPRINV